MARMNWSRFSRNNYERGARRNNYNIYDASDERYSTVTRKQKAIMYRIIENERSNSWEIGLCKSCLIATNLSIKQKNVLNKMYLRVLCNYKQ
jgi:hypothetical protein